VYEFKSKENHYEWGLVGAKLIGNKKLKGNTTVESSPYELLIWFDSKNLPNNVTEIKNIILMYADSKNIAFQKENIYLSDETTVNNSKYYSIKNLELRYHNMICSITFLCQHNNEIVEYKTEIIFETDFKKFKRIIGV
jgi:hypothetical protein